MNRYRYGFNGYEKDDEVKGPGRHLSFADYGYDPLTGRRWNVDPMSKMFAFRSGYTYADNSPIEKIDVDGNADVTYAVVFDKDGYRTKFAVENPELSAGKKRSATGQFIHDKYVELKGWWKSRTAAHDVLQVTDFDDYSVILTKEHIGGEEADLLDMGIATVTLAAPYAGGSKYIRKALSRVEYLKHLKLGGLSDNVAKAIVDRGTLRATMKITDATKIAHHLIPVQALKNNKVAQMAVDAGFDFNSATNGYALDKAVHGSHKAYNDFVTNQLETWAKKNENEGYSAIDARKYIQNDLLPTLEKHVKKAESSGKTLNNYFKELSNTGK